MKKVLPIVLATSLALAAPALAQTPAPAAAPAAPAAATPTAATDADYQARVEAAQAYLKATEADKMVDDMLDNVAKNPNAHLTAADVADIKASIDKPALNKAMLDGMVKTFSLQELKKLGEFYSSPDGQSILKKMPVYMSSVMPTIQEQVKKAILAKMQQHGGMSVPGAAPATPATAPTTVPAAKH